MDFPYGQRWLEDHRALLDLLKRISKRFSELETQTVCFAAGDVLFREGERLSQLYLLTEGRVELCKARDDGRLSRVDSLLPGAFMGIIALTTGQASLTTARALEAGEAVVIDMAEFETLMRAHPRLQGHIQQLLLANLVDRYRHTVALQLRLDALNDALARERNELAEAYRDLERTQQRLIHQEKMATLGQLAAGFAHEVNNPVSSLTRAGDHLKGALETIFSHAEAERALFGLGYGSGLADSERVRARMDALSGRFPELGRATLRKLAGMAEEALELIESAQGEGWERRLAAYESGRLLRKVELAGLRIADLVQSMKSYSRPAGETAEWVDVRAGLNDTLKVLSNRLKFLNLALELDPVPPIRAVPGELNQVWTNLIVNACDAMGKTGTLRIATGADDHWVWVRFEDTGPGVPDALKARVFEPNFTSKRQGTHFGLGLGLAIAKEIVEKHEGRIALADGTDGGAAFAVWLPRRTDGE